MTGRQRSVLIRRRGFLGGLLAGGVLLAAPAIIRTPGLLMPVKPPLKDIRFWRLSKIYLAKEGEALTLPEIAKYFENVETIWQREQDSVLHSYRGQWNSGEVNTTPDRREVLAKTFIDVPAGIDLGSLGEGWNVEGASSSRLSRL